MAVLVSAPQPKDKLAAAVGMGPAEWFRCGNALCRRLFPPAARWSNPETASWNHSSHMSESGWKEIKNKTPMNRRTTCF